jgi:RimJ/RimL family protein N-acetyltransferase
MRHYGRLANPGAGQTWLGGVRRIYATHGYGPLSVELHDGTFVGQCGPLPQEIDGAREIEIVCFFERPYWRFGLAEEAARACIRDAFERLATERIIALVFPENKPSARLALRCGLRFERDVVVDGSAMRLYALTQADFAVKSAS